MRLYGALSWRYGDKLNHPSLVHDDFVRKNKSRVDDYIILNYLLLITHLKIITVRSLFIYMIYKYLRRYIINANNKID